LKKSRLAAVNMLSPLNPKCKNFVKTSLGSFLWFLNLFKIMYNIHVYFSGMVVLTVAVLLLK